jgi:hypothetical protein
MKKIIFIALLLTFNCLASVRHSTTQTAPPGNDIAVPADAVWTSDCSPATTKVPWEFENWNSTTGFSTIFFLVGTLSHAVDTVYCVSYNSNATTTWQGNVSGTWSAGNFVGVWHLGALNAGHTNVPDSTSNLNSLTGAGIGHFATGILYNGIDGTLGGRGASGTTGLVSGSSTRTIEAWVTNNSAVDSAWRYVGGYGVKSNGQGWSLAIQSNITTFGIDASGQESSASQGCYNATYPTNDSPTFHHVVGVFPAASTTISQTLLYLDGVSKVCTAVGGATTVNTNLAGGLAIGFNPTTAANNPYTTGVIDEFRISSDAKTNDWITATYNNIHSNSSFVAVGAEDVGCTPFTGFAHCKTLTLNHTLVPNTDQTNFPVAMTGTFTFLILSPSGGYLAQPIGGN